MMNQEIVVNFSTTGVVSALHFDAFDLGFLGDKKIGRASTIEFDEVDQSFFVLIDGEDSAPEIAQKFCGYDVARKFEVEWLQACMRAGNIHPHSQEGLSLANSVRTSRELYNQR